ncbi:hypothetical protein COL516b_001788 [Colletotrichum fioriniae]|nr:uncharacterized protein COL516b_001788 [Colletotrichum fioriniae]KAJ0311085.1 hypothetical protein COL516b_001788 [Colletotrichum fioriniae]
MIDKVFLQQERLIKKYQRRRGLSSIEVDGLHSLLTGLVGRRARVQELAQDAQSVELSYFLNKLNNLLDMKQKQGNLHMVRDTRRRALEGEGQTKLLFVFTIVTVIFG